MTAEDELDQLGVRLLTAESLEEMGLNGGQTAEDELDQLGVRLLTAESLEEMGLNGGQSR
jgi:hypothetical protein